MSYHPSGPIDDEIAWHEQARADTQKRFLADVVMPEGFSATLTCESVPEQWEIFYNGQQVGYLRCRFSRWRLDYPDCGGETLLAGPWHPERSQYESNFDDERPAIFDQVCRAIVERVTSPAPPLRGRGSEGRGPA